MTRSSQILIQHLCYTTSDGKCLFDNLSISIAPGRKIGLVGRNGIGKSTLLDLIIGDLAPNRGNIEHHGTIAYCEQSPAISANTRVADCLDVSEKWQALQRILQGSTNEQDYNLVADDWSLNERIHRQLDQLGLAHLELSRNTTSISGGELTRLHLAKAFLAKPDFILLDEPTNNLDTHARSFLYEAIINLQEGLLVISHDRALLNLMDEIIELNTLGAKSYGGNYDFYQQQKVLETAAIEQEVEHAEKSLRNTKHGIQAKFEQHQQKQAYGKRLRRNGRLDKITLDGMQGRSEKTQGKYRLQNERLMSTMQNKLSEAKSKQEISTDIVINLDHTKVPQKKVLITMEKVGFSFDVNKPSIIQNFSLIIQGPCRLAITGENGSGKTTLIKLLTGDLEAQSGKISLGTDQVNYLDQQTSLLQEDLSVLENFQLFNEDMSTQDCYFALAPFLFRNKETLKLVGDLSGGEKLRAALACTLMAKNPPQLLILDEPTNHLDFASIASIESALRQFQGALIIISHDAHFLQNIGIEQIIEAPFRGTNH